MSRLVAVGDIHGCSKTLAQLLEILDLGAGDTLLCTGDLSSKGEDSKGVHEQLLRLEDRGVKLILLLGNHELMLLAIQRMVGADVKLQDIPESIFRGADVSSLVRSNEVWATLKSYNMPGAEDAEFWSFRHDHPAEHFERTAKKLESLDWQLPEAHLDLLCRGKTHHIERGCFFVHSGIQPIHIEKEDVHQAVGSQIDEDARELCWNRQWLRHTPGFPELMIHGHTPLPYLHSYVPDTTPWRDIDLVFKSTIHNGALNLDSGVFLEAGHLSAAEIPESGRAEEIRIIRVPRLDPVCKDRLWFRNFR